MTIDERNATHRDAQARWVRARMRRVLRTQHLGGGALLGLLFPLADGLRLRTDLALGESLILVDVRALDCERSCSSSVHAGRTWLEPRLVIDAWATPWWTVSAWSALDVLHVPDVSVGLTVGFHLRSFDGFP